MYELTKEKVIEATHKIFVMSREEADEYLRRVGRLNIDAKSQEILMHACEARIDELDGKADRMVVGCNEF